MQHTNFLPSIRKRRSFAHPLHPKCDSKTVCGMGTNLEKSSAVNPQYLGQLCKYMIGLKEARIFFCRNEHQYLNKDSCKSIYEIEEH